MDIRSIAEAFSRHQFDDALPYLASDARWVSVGGSTLEGRDAIISACRDTSEELAQTSTDFSRFVSVMGADAVAVDAVGRYTDAGGDVSVVSSCDIYEFDADVVTTITSYAVELSA